MKSKGFGDSVEKFTKATGIKTIVDNVSKGLNIPADRDWETFFKLAAGE